jgi:hypothetical protein
LDYPPNSKAGRHSDQSEPRVTESVASATRRKKPLGKQFKATFFNGSASQAFHYMIFNVLVPAAKDAMVDAGSAGIERLIFGESRRKGASHGAPGRFSYGHTPYNQMSRSGPPSAPRTMSSRARQQHDFDEILLPSRREAETVIERLYDLLSQYEAATVADLYALVGLSSTHTDRNWGWTDLRGTQVRRVRDDGYLLDLPEPEFLD